MVFKLPMIEPISTNNTISTIGSINIEKMESMAFINNPDIREKLYLSRISIDDAKKSLITYLPGLELKGGRNFNSNSFLDSNGI